MDIIQNKGMIYMEDQAGRYYILDGAVREASEPVRVETASGRTAYEVIRIIRGVPLFYQDHYDRIKATFKSIGLPLEMDAGQLTDDMKKLLKVNGLSNCNVKAVLFDEAGKQRKLIYISRSYYPSEEEASRGVKAGLFRIERQNPNAKLINQTYKDAVNKKIQEGGYFEVLLVDSLGRITEGSKSNAFFVKGNKIFTAPGQFVLKGITRKYVFEACKSAGFEVVEEFIGADSLVQADGAFFSGTSIKVLPIRTIDEIILNSSENAVVSAVRREYDRLLEKYIEEYVKIW